MSRRLLIALALLGALAAPACAASWGNAAIVERDGFPIFEYAGKPYFLYGAAFFYERLPRELWASSMDELQALGINTLDLYVPWNWHETSDGAFDFDGHTNPRRDLDTVLRLARAHGFAIVLRPGPVIRNEWRNGGYPAWLLTRPEYGMPLHDVLEGRYPATATLQNAHSDDAAAQWMRNATHVRYARRWLQRVLRECAPFAGRIVAVALDDDQGAYIDNQTYPAPHFIAYLDWLRGVVHAVTGPRELVFINTYQMKVPASSPVWAMGNWYQSDAYALGEHDRAQLEFSTALLHTRPHQPLFASEFQAGWLEAPDDVRPRPADPGNTSLALGTLFALGVRGIVNFPAQDTLYPSGWEVPFANAFYAWDAALALDGSAQPRYAPTAEFGALVRRYGTELAAAQPRDDAAIAWLGGSFAPADSTNALYGDLAAQTIAAQQACRAAGLACTLVDPAAIDARALERYPVLIVPYPTLPGAPMPGASRQPAPPAVPAVRAALAAYTRAGGRIIPGVPPPSALLRALNDAGRRPSVEGIADATFASVASPGVIEGFLTVTNYGDSARTISGGRVEVDGRAQIVPSFTVLAHHASVVPVRKESAAALRSPRTSPGPQIVTTTNRNANANSLPLPLPSPTPPALSNGDRGLPLRDDALLPILPLRTVAPGSAVAYFQDVFRDADAGGAGQVVLDNGIARVVIAPEAGARAFVFEDDATGRNVFTTVGAMRDDVLLEPPPSTTDRIARYTHQIPAGTFNRTYSATLASGDSKRAGAHFAYDAPDVVPAGARFERDVSLPAGERAFTVDETFEPDGAAGAADTQQRGVSVTSLAVGHADATAAETVFAPDPAAFAPGTTARITRGNALGYWDPGTSTLATVAWRAGDVENASIEEKRFSVLVRLVLARGRRAHLRFGYALGIGSVEARAAVAAADAAAQSAGFVP